MVGMAESDQKGVPSQARFVGAVASARTKEGAAMFFARIFFVLSS